jgi:hypothetical protein
VLFGLNTSEEDRSSPVDLAPRQYPHAELLQASKCPDAFGMIFAPVQN